MPKDCHISKLIFLWWHQKAGHSGRSVTLNEARNLLTMKSEDVIVTAGSFGPAATYCHKRWRRKQHTSIEFLVRWNKEFIQTLQKRKSCRRKRCFRRETLFF